MPKIIIPTVAGNTQTLTLNGSVLPPFDLRNASVYDVNLTASSSVTFAVVSGMVSVWVVKNATGGDLTIGFPSSKWAGGTPVTTVSAGKTNVYTFVCTSTTIYASCLDGMS